MEKRNVCRLTKDEKKHYSDNLMILRAQSGYTLNYVSICTGIPLSTYNGYEGGYCVPSVEREKVICDFWHVTPQDLLIPNKLLFIEEVVNKRGLHKRHYQYT